MERNHLTRVYLINTSHISTQKKCKFQSIFRCLSIIDVTGLLQFLDLDGSHGGGLDEAQMHSGIDLVKNKELISALY